VNSFTLFLIIVLLQTALIYFQNFSPFEREANLRAILWGAKPGTRYWAVLALDVCVGLLVAILVLAVLPRADNDAPLARLARFIPIWIAVSLLVAMWHSHMNNTIIRFPNYRLIARRGMVEFILGLGIVFAALYAIATALMPGYDLAWSAWLRTALPLLPVAGAIAALVFIARAFTFFLQVIPIVGSFLHAAASTYLLVWAMERYGSMMAGRVPAAGMNGMEMIAAGVGATAFIALIAAGRLRDEKRQTRLNRRRC
jgi:hypothetical protein